VLTLAALLSLVGAVLVLWLVRERTIQHTPLEPERQPDSEARRKPPTPEPGRRCNSLAWCGLYAVDASVLSLAVPPETTSHDRVGGRARVGD